MKTMSVVAVGVLVVGLSVWVGTGTGADPAGVPAPELAGVTAWVNTKPLKLADQKGKVVILHFWTNGCVNCVNNYPHYRAWQDKYGAIANLLMLGVHTPEFEGEKSVKRIEEQMGKHKLTFPVAVDNDQTTWKAWGNRYWPCVYLIDKGGTVRHRWEGELGDGGVKKMTAAVDALLAEPAPKAK